MKPFLPPSASLSVRATTLAMPTTSYYKDSVYLYRHRTGTADRPGTLDQMTRNGDNFWSIPPGNALFAYFSKNGGRQPATKSEWDVAMAQHLLRCQDNDTT